MHAGLGRRLTQSCNPAKAPAAALRRAADSARPASADTAPEAETDTSAAVGRPAAVEAQPSSIKAAAAAAREAATSDEALRLQLPPSQRASPPSGTLDPSASSSGPDPSAQLNNTPDSFAGGDRDSDPCTAVVSEHSGAAAQGTSEALPVAQTPQQLQQGVATAGGEQGSEDTADSPAVEPVSILVPADANVSPVSEPLDGGSARGSNAAAGGIEASHEDASTPVQRQAGDRAAEEQQASMQTAQQQVNSGAGKGGGADASIAAVAGSKRAREGQSANAGACTGVAGQEALLWPIF